MAEEAPASLPAPYPSKWQRKAAKRVKQAQQAVAPAPLLPTVRVVEGDAAYETANDTARDHQQAQQRGRRRGRSEEIDMLAISPHPQADQHVSTIVNGRDLDEHGTPRLTPEFMRYLTRHGIYAEFEHTTVNRAMIMLKLNFPSWYAALKAHTLDGTSARAAGRYLGIKDQTVTAREKRGLDQLRTWCREIEGAKRS